MLKLQRNYKAVFEIGTRKNIDFVPQETLTIEYPFTCQFSVTTGTYQSQNQGSFQFVNLSRDDQARLWLDLWNIGKKYIYMKFYAGYGDNMPLIFSGSVQMCTSEKQGGSTDYITEMQVWAGGDIYRDGYLNATFTEGTTLQNILDYALKDQKEISVGYVTPDIQPLPRNKTFIGQTLDLLGRAYGGYEVFINNDEINILGNRDLIPGEVAVISDDSGLLGSPKRANGYVECDMIFEPQLKAGQGVSLLSYTMPWLNQAYKIIRVQHSGIISPVISGNLVTSITLSIFEDEPRVLEKVKTGENLNGITSGRWTKPVQGSITSPFGYRAAVTTTNGKKSSTYHKGIDIGANMNAPVTAPANGVVTFVGWNDGYGKAITINHGTINGKKVISLYGHLSSWTVSPNQKITQGQDIGRVGSTGNSTGPHLHFEITEDGVAVNPTYYIGNY